MMWFIFRKYLLPWPLFTIQIFDGIQFQCIDTNMTFKFCLVSVLDSHTFLSNKTSRVLNWKTYPQLFAIAPCIYRLYHLWILPSVSMWTTFCLSPYTQDGHGGHDAHGGHVSGQNKRSNPPPLNFEISPDFGHFIFTFWVFWGVVMRYYVMII